MMQVANVLGESVVDGIGIRLVVFFQGCKHYCKGCHNPDLLPFEGGKNYSVKELSDKILASLTDIHRGVTFSGGDPLYQREELTALIDDLRARKPDIHIWVYTGFTYEELKDDKVLEGIDVLVDGPFILEKKNLLLRFRGSSNQRIIDVQKSLKEGTVKEYIMPE